MQKTFQFLEWGERNQRNNTETGASYREYQGNPQNVFEPTGYETHHKPLPQIMSQKVWMKGYRELEDDDVPF